MHTYKNINFTKNITQIQIIDLVTRESILHRTREAKNEDKGMVSREKITRGNRLLNVASV